MSRFTERRRRAMEGVLRVLKIDPHIADGPDYARLCLLYWCHVDGVMTHDREQGYYYTTPERFATATSSESITRAFRRLVEREVVKLSLPTEAERREREELYRSHYGRDRP